MIHVIVVKQRLQKLLSVYAQRLFYARLYRKCHHSVTQKSCVAPYL